MLKVGDTVVLLEDAFDGLNSDNVVEYTIPKGTIGEVVHSPEIVEGIKPLWRVDFSKVIDTYVRTTGSTFVEEKDVLVVKFNYSIENDD